MRGNCGDSREPLTLSFAAESEVGAELATGAKSLIAICVGRLSDFDSGGGS